MWGHEDVAEALMLVLLFISVCIFLAQSGAG